MTDILQSFGENIWTLGGDDVRMFGIPFTTRMTIVRLASGDLWLHSPVKPTAERRAAIQALGQVAYLVAPNKFHSLGVGAWKEHCLDAEVWVSPEFTTRHKDAVVEGVLDGGSPWTGEIEHTLFGGNRIFLFDEMIFFHAASRTLIVTDVIQRHDPKGQGMFWTGIKRMIGVLGEEGGVAIDLRLTLRDKEAVRQSVAHILKWPFDKMIISHGFCAQEDARAIFERSFEWLN